MINKKLYEPFDVYQDETDFFTEEEELKQDLEEWEIIKKIQREYSDWENLPDGQDDLMNRFLDDLFN